MSGNLPDGCDPNDPRFNEEDKPWAKCHICGDGGYIEYDQERGFHCICDTCKAEGFAKAEEEDCKRKFQEGYYSNVTACPSCHAETTGLKIHTDIHGIRVACSCGVSASYEDSIEEALDAWNELF